jgi:hypothetical protein
MGGSIILEKMPSEIQGAMGIALLRLKTQRKLTLDDIGSVIGRSKESASQYISDATEMSAVCWVKATAKWPELNDLLLEHLDEAEMALRAKQRSFNLVGPAA